MEQYQVYLYRYPLDFKEKMEKAKRNYNKRAYDLLKKLYQENVEKDIAENLTKLPDFKNMMEAINHAKIGIVKSFRSDGIVTYIGKVKGEERAVFLPRKDEEEKNMHTEIEGDFIKIEDRLPTNIFPNKQRLVKNDIKMSKTPITYMTQNGKIINGKIVGYGQDDRTMEVIFQPDKGTKFAININSLEDGMEKIKEKEERKTEKIDAFKKVA